MTENSEPLENDDADAEEYTDSLDDLSDGNDGVRFSEGVLVAFEERRIQLRWRSCRGRGINCFVRFRFLGVWIIDTSLLQFESILIAYHRPSLARALQVIVRLDWRCGGELSKSLRDHVQAVDVEFANIFVGWFEDEDFHGCFV